MLESTRRLTISILMLLLLSTCYGAGFFFIKISLDGFSNLSAGALRIVVAPGLMMTVSACGGESTDVALVG